MASDETSRISGIDYNFRGCSHSLVEPTALWALGLARLQLASVRAGERAEVALAAAPREGLLRRPTKVGGVLLA